MNMRGFSLVELLVVLAIAASLVALVGPLGFSTVERARAQTELVSIQRWYDRMGYTAFIRSDPVYIEWSSDGVAVARTGSDEVVGEKDISLLSFSSDAPVTFNSSGVPSQASITFLSRSGRQYAIDLSGALSVRSAY
jgi:prepilin-type N-terminal cleavage/methylation domain-containing protein